MLHPQVPKDTLWFWTIVAREIPSSIHNRGYSATREQAMADFKGTMGGEYQLNSIMVALVRSIRISFPTN